MLDINCPTAQFDQLKTHLHQQYSLLRNCNHTQIYVYHKPGS